MTTRNDEIECKQTGKCELQLDNTSLIYTPFYCEENVWKLCELIRDKQNHQIDNCFAVFISNLYETVPLWSQKLGNKENDHMVVWDYHVIMIHRDSKGISSVFDFDSVLEFPCNFRTYTKAVFKEERIENRFHYRFRVIEAQKYLETFASDRSRMRRKDGSFVKPPPPYDPICTPTETNNINNFISMKNLSQFSVGQVITLNELHEKFS